MSLNSREARGLGRELLDDTHGADPVPEGPPPERIGSYRIARVIGSGGMGTVYEALQENPRRVVALKVMRRGIASSKAAARISHEAEILGRLRHPAIAQVYEAGAYDDGTGSVPWFAMEYVADAQPLTRYAADRGLSMRERVELFAQVCDAVYHGHQKGIIHRDLKPANILVDGAGRPKVIDFGVARATDSDVTLTTLRADARQLVGTLQYMSPEQCDSDALDLDVRSDVYALGVILYELLCGRVPYDLSGLSITQAMAAVRQREPPGPRTVERHVRKDLEAVLLKALEKDRDRRYRGAAQLGDDLRRWIDGDPVSARPLTTWTRAVKWSRRHPLVATGTGCAVIVVLALALTFASVWFLSRVPYRIIVTDDNREAWLLSAAGAVLHKWPSNADDIISFGQLVEDPRGRKIALVGFYEPGGALAAFEWTGLSVREIWSRKVSQIPENLAKEGYTAGAFGMLRAWVVDVFPEKESPGPEVVAAFLHGPGSLCVLRVYDLRGEVRFEMWHDGHITGLHWTEAERLLVLSGLSSEAFWPERGYPEITSGNHPLIVMAVRPRLDWRGTQKIVPGRGDGDGAPVWYRTVLPPRSADQFWIDVLRADADDPSTGAFKLVLGLKGDRKGPSASILVDKDGNVVPGHERSTNQFQALPDPPDLREIQLADLPSITHPRP